MTRSTVDALAASLYHFIGAVPPKMVKFMDREYPREIREDMLGIAHFRQEWGNTACMFDDHDGLAGASVTPAWTTVVWFEGVYAVYCDGRRAYAVERPNEAFLQDLDRRRMAGRRDGAVRYQDEPVGKDA